MNKRLIGTMLALGLASMLGAYTQVPWAIQGYNFIPTNAAGRVMLTNNSASCDGVAWNPCPITMSGNWDLQFVFNFGTYTGLCGGDGMAFILQSASNNGGSPTTSSGPVTGVSDSGEKAYLGTPNSLAIAFDTYPHAYPGRPNYSCMNILVDGDSDASDSDVVGCGSSGSNAVVVGPCFPAISYIMPDVRDGLDHPVEISWNSATMTLAVTVDGGLPVTWVLPAAYATSIFGGNSSVIYGLGASSGGAVNFQTFAQTNANPSLCVATPTAGPSATSVPALVNPCAITVVASATPTPTFSPTATPASGGGFTVVSAVITYASDDYFAFWVNGNQVVSPTALDPGSPFITASINPAFFSVGGAPNYFAAEDLSLPSLVGCTWLISLTAADGSVAYVSSADVGISMYDDPNGTAPPALNAGNAWYQPSWIDAGDLFSQAPVATNAITWFNPQHLTNPATGNSIPVLSHSLSGSQTSANENLYFRESAVLTGIVPTRTPTPYPTVCGTPMFQAGAMVDSGCPSGGVTNVNITNPGGPGQILLLTVDSPNALSAVTYANVPMTLLVNSGTSSIYYLLAPRGGTWPLRIVQTGGSDYCSFYASYSLIDYVDQSAPMLHGPFNSSANAWTDSFTPANSGSIIVDYVVNQQGGISVGTGNVMATGSSGNGYDFYLSYLMAPSLPFSYSNNCCSHSVVSRMLELLPPQGCAGATATPSYTATPTYAPGGSATRTPTGTPTFTDSPTPTGTTVGGSPTASPSRTPIFSATVTSTPYPTACGAVPALVMSTILNSAGCAGNGNPIAFALTLAANPGQILIANAELNGPTMQGPPTWAGTAMTQAPGSPVSIPGGGLIYTYYLTNPAVGDNLLAFNVTSGCSWNASASVYKNVDPVTPLGATQASSGNASTFVDPITATSAFSVIHDFFGYPNGPFTFSGMTGTELFPANTSNCCDDAYGSYLNTTGPGAYSMNYSQSSGSDNWGGEAIELRAMTACGSPTRTLTGTPSSTKSPTYTATVGGGSPSPSRTVTSSSTATSSATPTNTATATPSSTPGGGPATSTPFPTVCGTPNFQMGANFADGCPGASPSVTFANPGGPGQLLLVEVDAESGSVSGVSCGGNSMALAVSTGTMSLWYLIAPPAGSVTVTVNQTANCSFNAGYSLFDDVDQATPFVAHTPATQSGNSFSDTFAPIQVGSLALDYISVANGVGLTNNGASIFAENSGYGPSYYVSDKPSSGLPFNYTGNCCGHVSTSLMLELLAPGCGIQSPTPTPTTGGGSPSPTSTPGGLTGTASCGAPVLVEAANMSPSDGCMGGAPNLFAVVTVPAIANGLMLVRMENGSGSSAAGSVTYNGALFTLLRTDPGYIGSLSTYYLAAPAVGAHSLVINGISGCSWNIAYEVYAAVDQVSPIGDASTGNGTVGTGLAFSATLSTRGADSLVSDFVQSDQELPGAGVTLGRGQVPLNYSSDCCETVFGDIKLVGGPGTKTLTYKDAQAGKRYAWQLVELRGQACPTRTPTPLTTLPPVADPPPHTIFPYPQPCRGPLLHFAYYMLRPGQANLHIFNAAGVALGGLDEHRGAGPQVGTLQVSAFASGVYYFQMEIRYDAGDREMLKVGKFLILRP